MPAPWQPVEHTHSCNCGEPVVTDCLCTFSRLQATCEDHRRFHDPDQHECEHCGHGYNEEEIFCRCGSDVLMICDECAHAPSSAFHRHHCETCGFSGPICRRDDSGDPLTSCGNCRHLARARRNSAASPRVRRHPNATDFTVEQIQDRITEGRQWKTAEGGSEVAD